jgi:hypothetical protein
MDDQQLKIDFEGKLKKIESCSNNIINEKINVDLQTIKIKIPKTQVARYQIKLGMIKKPRFLTNIIPPKAIAGRIDRIRNEAKLEARISKRTKDTGTHNGP